ncbi:MAG: hypothetical protein GC206_10005 [Alphaproteobacteria bacterium]|nr:hypothetical protein [Alphaproteobacteria bacterium]
MARALLLAGNGVLGARTARRLAALNVDTRVHHAGRRPVPKHDRIAEVVVARAPPPVDAFPVASDCDVAVHFYCMGAPDAASFVAAFDGRAKRLVLISSCDVYRAYGRFLKIEPGPPDPAPLDEAAPLRSRLYPYRSRAANADAMEHWYEKIEAERTVSAARQSEVVILRLPKVYAEDSNQALATVYGFAHQPRWRWTHGLADNLAAAIALAALHPAAAGETFNLGEHPTPATGERLARLAPRPGFPPAPGDYDFAQDMAFDTTKIRRVLGYTDDIDETDAMRAISQTGALRAEPVGAT